MSRSSTISYITYLLGMLVLFLFVAVGYTNIVIMRDVCFVRQSIRINKWFEKSIIHTERASKILM